jgi:fermentation-respiration switch protein FrsA (DUF1100 family)
MMAIARPATGDSPAPRRVTRARILLLLALLPVCGYGSAMVWLVTQETRIVFQAGRPLGESRPAFPYEQVDIPRNDGARQFAWVMRNPDARAWVLFLHGNSATIASRVNIARYRELRALGLSVLAPEYRGFAGLPGVPTESGLAEDARAAFDYLTRSLETPPTRVVIYGWSLGSAVAVHLASRTPAGAVILEGAPASLVEIGQLEYPFFPIRLLMRNPFESILRISGISAPMLFLHSPADDIVPIAQGRRLYDAAPGPKRFVEVRGGHIYANDVDRAVFYGAIRAFLDDYGLLGHQE